jgi:FkbM family methyltransferase
MTSLHFVGPVLVSLVILFLGGAVVWSISPLRILVLVALGRSWCPLPDAMKATRNQTAKRQLKAVLTKTARIVTEDGEFVLWGVGDERYWLPRGSRILPGMLAEQKLGVYEMGGGVKKEDVVLDCGASIGLYTLHALTLGASRIIAIEPSPRNVECLKRNLAEPIRASRVVVVAKGVWEKEEMRTLRMQPKNSAADSVALNYRGSVPGPQVPLTTIDAIVCELGLERLDYIKMDTEGAERAALVGASDAIRRFHPRMTIAMEHRFTDPREIPRIVAAIANDYRITRGPCLELGNALRPATLNFY